MHEEDVPDLSGASLQRSFLDTKPDRPSATSTLYIRRFYTKTGGGGEDHTVVGVHIVLAKGHPNKLWESFHVDRADRRVDSSDPRMPVRSLMICADTLEVRGEFSLPEADVQVFARRLVWADEAASINTSPLPWSIGKAPNADGRSPGQNGAAGRAAGSLRIFVREVESPDGDVPRLIARGGRGQDPGAGQDGRGGDWMAPISSYKFELNDSNISTSRRTVSFDPPAVYIDYEWRWGASRVWGPGMLGENRWPKNGTDALAPGVPGDGGDGGSLTTNTPALAATLRNEGGAAGTQERSYRGGSAGRPEVCAKYKVQLWHNLFGTNKASFERKQTGNKNVSQRGADAAGQPAPKGAGATPAPVVVDVANAWLHPLGVQAMLEHARDLFLAGARDDVLTLLAPYQEALEQSPPEVWSGVPESEWTAAQTEIASTLQRLRAHLDYFGHPAGYTPLLSLPGSIKLYEGETKRALRMMLLAGWIADVDREAGEAAGLLGEAIAATNADSQAAAVHVAGAEKRMAEITGLIESLTRDLTGLGNRLVRLRNDLLVKAENDLRKQAAIKFSIKMAGALCQVIPVGQPALGTVGSLAGVAADFVGADPDAAPDTLSKMGKVLERANEAAEKAAKASKEARKEQGVPGAADVAGAMEKSATLSQVGKGLGPGLALASDAIRALQVPRAEVDAALARLASEDPAWEELTREIEDLNAKKAVLFEDFADACYGVAEGLSRLAANAGAVVRLHQQRDKALGKVDPEAVYAMRRLGQRSRLTLQKYLYLLVKSYESALLQSPTVDWKLTAITEKLAAAVKPTGGLDAVSLNAQADALDELFQQNLSVLRSQLLDRYDFREDTISLQLSLSARQTPGIIATLNETGQVVIDPAEHGLLLPDRHLARMSAVKLSKLEFDGSGPTLPDTANAVLTLVPAETGTMRRGAGLYLLASDSPVRWRWTCLSSGKIHPAAPSATATDLLDFILGKGSETIRQKASLPPAWSDLVLSVQFSPPLPLARRPRISELHFEVQIDSSPAPEHQRVLTVRSSGAPAGAVTSCSPDLAHRGAGLDPLLRIYNKGQTVELSVPDLAGEAVFVEWDVIGRVVGTLAPRSAQVQLRLDDHTLAVSRWGRAGTATGPVVDLSQVVDPDALAAAAAKEPGHPATRRRLAARTRRRQPAAIPTAQPIRVEPHPTSVVVGAIPPDGDPEILKHGDGDWSLVNYDGVAGWSEVRDPPDAPAAP